VLQNNACNCNMLICIYYLKRSNFILRVQFQKFVLFSPVIIRLGYKGSCSSCCFPTN